MRDPATLLPRHWQRLKRFLNARRKAATSVSVAANFDDDAYLGANPDVAAAVQRGEFQSGRQHYEIFGRNERRPLRAVAASLPKVPLSLDEAKARKLARLRPLLRGDMPFTQNEKLYDFLTEDLRSQFHIVATDAVSSNDYDAHVLNLIERHANGWILDCGAGKRSVYYDNVVNFEIVAYDTTDVRGVGEVLPFADNSFDAVVSIAVLEHVKDPFRCAAEIARVLKPGGDLICCVPFLQPYHGYPHHYYNMTHQGLTNLFAPYVEVDRVEVYASVLPIWSLAWIIGSWADGLKGKTRSDFLNMRLEEFLVSPQELLRAPFVTELPAAKNLELASACVLFGRKINAAK
ncbi:MAG: methyltransferase domain-containing protein [Rudaea sp.]|nr:methyltransferase domain-containing protein [Rudaea sp.]